MVAIHAAQRGTLGGKPVEGMTLEDFEQAIAAGSPWIDERYAPDKPVSVSWAGNGVAVRRLRTPRPLTLWRTTYRPVLRPPVNAPGSHRFASIG
jgi:hypothetical protein